MSKDKRPHDPDKGKSRHDSFFKDGLAQQPISTSFLKSKLPPEMVAHMNFDKLTIIGENLITERLGHKVVDVLFTVPYKGELTMIYILIEHQSSVHTFMPFRLTLYSFLIIDDWLRARTKEAREGGEPPKKLPNIIPMVYYNGEFKYSGELELSKMFEDPKLFSDTINNPMMLVEKDDIDDALLRANALSHVFHTLMMNIYSKQINPIVLDLIPKMLQIEKESESGLEFVVRCFNYLITSAREFSKEDIVKAANKLILAREGAMTVYEQIHEEAYETFKDKIETAEQGKVEAERREVEAVNRARKEKTEIVKKFLRSGLDITLVAENFGLSPNEIEAIASDL